MTQYTLEFSSQNLESIQGLRGCQRTWPKDHCNQSLRKEKRVSGSKEKEKTMREERRERGKGRGKKMREEIVMRLKDENLFS